MKTAFIIAGAVFEFIGIVLLFAELANVVNRDVGAYVGDPGWMGAVRKQKGIGATLAALYHYVGGTMLVAGISMFYKPPIQLERLEKKRPEALPPDATTSQRLAHLEARLIGIEADIDVLEGRTARVADRESTVIRERLTALWRQALGPVCVLIGLLFGTIGNLM